MPAEQGSCKKLCTFTKHLFRIGLVDWVYGDLRNPAEYIHKAILTPKNSDVDMINDMVIDRLPGEARTYYSADNVGDDDDAQVLLYLR